MHRLSRKHSGLGFWWIQHISRGVLHYQCYKHDAVFNHLPISLLTSSHSHRPCLGRTAPTFEQSLQTVAVAAQK